jgi:hypothetical protein
MFCRYAWFGGVERLARRESQNTVELLLFGRLNGKYLGKLILPKHVDQECIHAVLTDLQRQAHKLMPHKWRPPSHVLLQVGDKDLLPFGFRYKHDLDSTERLEALALLQQCMHPSDPSDSTNKQESTQESKHIAMAYDDNDDYATYSLDCCSMGFSRFVSSTHRGVIIDLDENSFSFPSDVVVGLCNDFEASYVAFSSFSPYFEYKDFSFLTELVARNVKLCRVAPPRSSWSSLCHLVELWLEDVYVPPEISKLDGLKILNLDHVRELPDTLRDLHLHTVSLCRSSIIMVQRLLGLLVEMTSLSELSLVDNNTIFDSGSIPSELGALNGLTRLTIRNNNFEGSIPSELGYLTNLTDLMICERLDIDMPIPKEVLALQQTNTKLDILYFGG